MFPYTSPYAHLLSLHMDRSTVAPWDDPPPDPNQAPSQPWDIGNGLGIPDSDISNDSGSMNVASNDGSTAPNGSGFGQGPTRLNGHTNDARHQALASGLTALGAQLLAAAPRGDWGGGLGKGTAAFSEAYGGTMDASAKEAAAEAEARRKQVVDDRAALAAQDAHRAAVRSDTEGTAKFGQWQMDQQTVTADSAAKAQAAKDMVGRIQALAAKNPADQKLQAIAERAGAYNLADQSDLNKLGALHEEMTGQAFHAQDAAQATGDKITGLQSEIKAGVIANPVDAAAARQKALAISQGHLDVARQRASEAADRGTAKTDGKPMTDLQLYHAIEKKVAAKARAYSLTPAGSLRKPIPFQVNKWTEEATAEAEAEMKQAKKLRNNMYHFDSSANLLGVTPGDSGGEDGNP